MSGDETADHLEGRVLRGKYTLESVLGRGGMATVYRATHRNGSKVAVKILHPAVANMPSARERFLREGYAANKVDHPGTAKVLDDDTDDDGLAFIVMELLEGETLGRMQARLGHALPPERALRALRDLLYVLEAAHARGIVHRDIKPDNIFLTHQGELKVLDFGIARLREADGSSSSMTQTGQVTGTPAFMAPEQALGRTREVDVQTDLWAAGATIFTLLTNRYVHQAESLPECLVYAGSRAAPPFLSLVPGAPPALAYVIDRALAFHKSDRWQSAREMREALEAAVPAYLVPGQPPSAALPPLSTINPGRTLQMAESPVPGSLPRAPVSAAALAPPSTGLPSSSPQLRSSVQVSLSTTGGLAGDHGTVELPVHRGLLRRAVWLLPIAVLASGLVLVYKTLSSSTPIPETKPAIFAPTASVVNPPPSATVVAPSLPRGIESTSAPRPSTSAAPVAASSKGTARPAGTPPPASATVIPSGPKKNDSLYNPNE